MQTGKRTRILVMKNVVFIKEPVLVTKQYIEGGAQDLIEETLG